MIRYFSLLFLYGFFFFISGTVAREAIISGEPVKITAFPYQISLWDDHQGHVCGGAIIRKQYIVTAAHCVVKESGEFHEHRKLIIAGTDIYLKTEREAVKAKIDTVFIRKTFNYQTFIDDISVLKLEKPLEFSSRINEVNLPSDTKETYVHKIAKISGFGWDHIDLVNGINASGNNGGHLRFALVDVLSHDQKGYDVTHTHADRQICARSRQNPHPIEGPAVCFGDSGSPLVFDNTIIGILSTVPDLCSERKFGAIYTRVTHYIDFIHDVVHGRNHDQMHIHKFRH